MPIKNKQIQVTTDFDINNNNLINVADPVEELDVVNKQYIDVLGDEISTYSTLNKDMTANITVSDGDLALSDLVVDVVTSTINVAVNGNDVNIGPGLDCYFQNPVAPFEIRNNGEEKQGDELRWNGSIANYQLTNTDRIEYWYLTDLYTAAEITFGEVIIGTQTWSDKSITFDDGLGGIFSPNNDSVNDGDYGNLYTYAAAVRVANLVSGWRLPTQAEITTLAVFAAGANNLKETGTTYWDSSNGGNNSLGFNGRGAGFYDDSGSVHDEFKERMEFWTTTDYDASSKYILQFTYNDSNSVINFKANVDAISIRLIKE